MRHRYVAIVPIAIAVLFLGCQSSSTSGPQETDGDTELSPESETEVPDTAETDFLSESDADSDEVGVEIEAEVEVESETEAGWDYRLPWRAPDEDWSSCPSIEHQGGKTLREKAAYYDWIVPKLHQVPLTAVGHESYSTVYKINCDANVPTSIVADEQLPFCLHDLTENNGLWTSLYVASQAFRYATTHDAEALAQLRRTLNGTYQMLLITGKAGLYTRDMRDPSLPQQYCIEAEEPYASAVDLNVKYARYIPPTSNMVGNSFIKVDTDGCFMDWDTTLNDGAGGWRKYTEYCTDTRFAGFCWQRNASKDEYAGHMFAAGIVAKLIDDPEIHQMAVDILQQVGHHLVDHNFWINDFDGRNTRYGSAHAMSLDEMPGSNAIMALDWIKEAAVASGDEELISTYYDCLLQRSGERECIDQPFETPKDYREYLDSMGLALGCGSNYDTISIAVLNYFNLIWYEEDADLRAFYRRKFRENTKGPDLAGRDLWGEGDPFKNMILVSMMESDGYNADEAKGMIEAAVCSLKRFRTDNVRRAYDSTGYGEWCQSSRHGSLAEAPIPVEERCASIFEWWGDPNEREACADEPASAEPPAGYLLPYWMGRYFGFISEQQ